MSVGTERMLVEFAKAGWIDKARQQPVFNKLDQPLPLGYCNVGTVVGGQSSEGGGR